MQGSNLKKVEAPKLNSILGKRKDKEPSKNISREIRRCRQATRITKPIKKTLEVAKLGREKQTTSKNTNDDQVLNKKQKIDHPKTVSQKQQSPTDVKEEEKEKVGLANNREERKARQKAKQFISETVQAKGSFYQPKEADDRPEKEKKLENSGKKSALLPDMSSPTTTPSSLKKRSLSTKASTPKNTDPNLQLKKLISSQVLPVPKMQDDEYMKQKQDQINAQIPFFKKVNKFIR